MGGGKKYIEFKIIFPYQPTHLSFCLRNCMWVCVCVSGVCVCVRVRVCLTLLKRFLCHFSFALFFLSEFLFVNLGVHFSALSTWIRILLYSYRRRHPSSIHVFALLCVFIDSVVCMYVRMCVYFVFVGEDSICKS